MHPVAASGGPISDSPFAPASGPTGAAVDLDAEPPRPGWTCAVSGGMQIVSALFGGAYALQLLVFIIWYDAAWIVPMTFGALALAQLPVGALVTRGSLFAVVTGVVLAVLQALLAVGWNVYAVLQTLFSPLGILWMLVAVPAVVAAVLALPAALRIRAWRRALTADLAA